MGNRQSRKTRTHQPYNQMVEDAISALKERPCSTPNEVFGYLEEKYGGRISPKAKRNLESVIRSNTMKTRKRPRRGGKRGSPVPRVRFKSKQTGPVPRRRGRPKAQKQVKLRKPIPRLEKPVVPDNLFPSGPPDSQQPGPSNSLEEALMESSQSL